MARKPLINIKVPKAGRITTGRLVGAAVMGGMLIAAWNWSERIPGVGKYAALGKYYIARGLGYDYLIKPTV